MRRVRYGYWYWCWYAGGRLRGDMARPRWRRCRNFLIFVPLVAISFYGFLFMLILERNTSVRCRSVQIILYLYFIYPSCTKHAEERTLRQRETDALCLLLCVSHADTGNNWMCFGFRTRVSGEEPKPTFLGASQ